MAEITNTQRIVREDFDKEYQGLVDKLGYVLNPFMEQTVRQVNGNLDASNLSADIITVKMKVDSNGTPVGNDLVRSNVSRPIGTTVISATNKDDASVYPTSHPFISFTTGTNSKVMKIKNISGLQANAEYDLVIKVE